MKKTWVCLFTVLIAVFMALPAQAAQDKKAKDPVVKVGVIDMKRIMRESKAAKSAQAVFRRDLDAKRAVLVAKQKEIQVMEEELKGADLKLDDDSRRQKTEKMTREIRELKLLTTDMEAELKKKDVELTQNIVGEVIKVVNAYAKKESITLVLERSAVVALDEAVDITNTVIQLYDAGK